MSGHGIAGGWAKTRLKQRISTRTTGMAQRKNPKGGNRTPTGHREKNPEAKTRPQRAAEGSWSGFRLVDDDIPNPPHAKIAALLGT